MLPVEGSNEATTLLFVIVTIEVELAPFVEGRGTKEGAVAEE